MIIWNEKLYMDEKVSKHPKRYQKRLEKKGMLPGFCICLSENEKNSLEIYSSRTKWYWYHHQKGIHIVGVASTYDNALDLISRIITDVNRVCGQVDTASIRNFLQGGDGAQV